MKTLPVRQIMAYLMRPEDSSDPVPAWLPPGGPGIATRLLEMVKIVLWTAIALVLAYGISLLSDAHSM